LAKTIHGWLPGSQGGGSTGAKAIAAKDLVIGFGVGLLTPVAWLAPESLWRRLAHAMAPITEHFVGSRRRQNVETIRRLVGERAAGRSPEAVEQEAFTGYVEETLQLLRAYSPLARRPAIRLEGGEHITAALERGHGAILWVGHFTFYSLVPKIAFFEAGHAASHLSHPRHGFSGTRFGMRWLNPIRNSIEDRYLKERVFLALDSSVGAMRTLQKRLRANGVVSSTVREMARRPIEVPFLADHIRLASGAPDLAYSTGAALLPVFPVREADGSFVVYVEPAIACEEADSRHAYARCVLERYAALLESYVLRYPGQWRGWHHQ
jgi:lauroyl/myristoyl acyltransferase